MYAGTYDRRQRTVGIIIWALADSEQGITTLIGITLLDAYIETGT
jgi:hypothetical protein